MSVELSSFPVVGKIRPLQEKKRPAGKAAERRYPGSEAREDLTIHLSQGYEIWIPIAVTEVSPWHAFSPPPPHPFRDCVAITQSSFRMRPATAGGGPG